MGKYIEITDICLMDFVHVVFGYLTNCVPFLAAKTPYITIALNTVSEAPYAHGFLGL